MKSGFPMSGVGCRAGGGMPSSRGCLGNARQRPAPRGFTLLEVLLAVFVVVTAVVLLSEGYTQNLRAINDNRVDTTLAFLAQWKMSEVVAGIIATDQSNEGSFEEEGFPGYEWHIESDLSDVPGLTTVHVTARLVNEETSREFTLHRLVYQPEGVLEFGL